LAAEERASARAGICGYFENSISRVSARVCARTRVRRRIKSGANWISILCGGCAGQAAEADGCARRISKPPSSPITPHLPQSYLSLSLSLNTLAVDFFKPRSSLGVRSARANCGFARKTSRSTSSASLASKLLFWRRTILTYDTFRQIRIETDSEMLGASRSIPPLVVSRDANPPR